MRNEATTLRGFGSFSSGPAVFLFFFLGACGGIPDSSSESKSTRSNPTTAPSGLSYSNQGFSLIKRVALPKQIPALSGGEATNFSISPALPEGLAFDFKNGAISGTPKNVLPLTVFTVSANNRKGVVSTSLNLEVLTTHAPSSTVEASPGTLIASPDQPALVTVTLLSKTGFPIPGERVALYSSRGPSLDQIEPQTAVTDPSGIAHFKVRSTTAGVATLFAHDLDDQITVTRVASVEFIAGPLHHFSFSKIPPVVKAGSPVEISVSARDLYDNLCVRHEGSVSLYVSDTRAVIPEETLSFQDGIAPFKDLVFKSAGIQSALVQDGDFATGPRNITVIPSDPHHLAFVTEPAATGAINAPLTQPPGVGVYDLFDNLVTDRTLSISLSATSDESCETQIPSALLSDQNPASTLQGTAGFTNVRLTKTSARRIKASASLAGIDSACSSPIHITSGSPDLAQSSILGTGPVVADGSSTLQVIVRIRDSFGNPVPGISPEFDATDTQFKNHYGACGESDESGESFCSLASTKAEQKTLRLTRPFEKTGSTVLFRNGPASEFRVQGFPGTVTAGTAGAITVSAFDAHGNAVVDHSGSLSLHSSDPNAVLPDDFQFLPEDGGEKRISGITLKTAGTHTITASDANSPSVSGSQSSILVAPAILSVEASSLSADKTSLVSGAIATVRLDLRDAFGNANPSPEPDLPDVSFSSSLVGGSGSFGTPQKTGPGVYEVPFTGIKAGVVEIDAKIKGSSISPSLTLTIQPGSVSRLALSGVPTSATAGSVLNLTVTALDAAGNTVPHDSAPVSISSMDPAADLPAPLSLEDGEASFSLVLKTAGPRTISVSDGTLSETSESIEVVPGAVSLTESSIAASAPRLNSKEPITVTLIAKDAFGNQNPSGVESISFTSSLIGGSGEFGDVQDRGSGIHTASFTGGASGAVELGALISSSAIQNTVSVTVDPGPAARIVFQSPPSSVVAGTTFSIGYSFQDAFGNVATSHSAEPTLSSDDPAALSPASHTTLISGSGAFATTLKTSGSITLTASGSGVTSATTTLNVSAGPVSLSKSVVRLSSSSVQSGSSVTLTLTAKDDYDNQNPSGITLVAFTAGTTGGSGTFGAVSDAGSGVYTASFTGNLGGLVALGATVNGETIESAENALVTPGPAVRLSLTGVPGSSPSGSPIQLGVTAYDAAGNVAQSHSDPVWITSTDASADLPASFSLSSGTGLFSVILNSAGEKFISVASGELQIQSSPISVISDPAPPAATPSWFVEILNGKSLCSGALLKSGTSSGIIAPADCVSGILAQDLTLRYHDKTSSKGSALWIHPQFNPESLAYDLALILPETQGGTPFDLHSDLIDPSKLSLATLFGHDSEKAVSSWSASVVSKAPDLKAFDPLYMFSAESAPPSASGGALVATDPDSKSTVLAGMRFYQSGGLHALVNLSSESIRPWIVEVFLRQSGGSASDAVTTLAGDGTPGSEDGSASAPAVARFRGLQGVAETSTGDLIVTDAGNRALRYLDLKNNSVTTLLLSSSSSNSSSSSSTSQRARSKLPSALDPTVSEGSMIQSQSETEDSKTVQDSGKTGAGFSSPSGVAIDPDTGDVYVSDSGTHTIQNLTLKSGGAEVNSVIGIAGTPGFDDGDSTSATFSAPSALAWHQGGLLILDAGNSALRYLKGGRVSTLSDLKSLRTPTALAPAGDGRIFITDAGDHTIRVYDPSSGLISLYAGIPEKYGFNSGKIDSATFQQPSGIAVDPSGVVYVSDLGNHAIRKIDTEGSVSTLSGTGVSGSTNGGLEGASFTGPAAMIRLSSGALIVLEPEVNRIRKISPDAK